MKKVTMSQISYYFEIEFDKLMSGTLPISLKTKAEYLRLLEYIASDYLTKV